MSVPQHSHKNWPELQLSHRVRSIEEALSIYINQLVYDMKRQGETVTTLSLGEAFFDLPLFDFSKLDKEKGFHYSSSRGAPELREKIARFYNDRYGSSVDADTNLLVTAGSKPAIFMALQAILDPGDEVLIPEPAWLSYQEHVRLLDAEPRFIRYDAPIDSFHEHFTSRTRILVLNNPNNPSGRIYTHDELRQIYETCRERGAYLLVDEAYSDFVQEQADFSSIASVVPDLDGVIVVNSLSKNLGMSGFRIGYTIADPSFTSVILKLNQHLITCAPSMLVHYVASYFDDIIEVTMPQIRKLVEKRNRVAAMMDSIGLDYLPGGGTFYFFVSLGDSPNDGFDLAIQLLLRERIAVVPGAAYGASTERFLRVSVGTESEEQIEHALRRIRAALIEPKYDSTELSRQLAVKGLPLFQRRGS
ncbi:pyridoxal phosphate-dependent aminotransferase [Lutibaculum baratangense]|nr:pyridoxal phosphate-dependent aminotransferase [Lutibaculum baratangense]